MAEAKPFRISKWVVLEAWEDVKANGGAAGVDGQTIEEFEDRLKDNLYRVWNRMSSGSYFPSAVRRVHIPKPDGGERPLGIPTVADRVAQTVAKRYLEPLVEPLFHEDSYGYRPGKSALDAVGKARQRCWRNDWVLDLDIRGFFDNIDHDLMMHAVRKHTDCRWLLLYVERWLKAPVIEPDGKRVSRDRGTPQGGVISPLLANLFLHHVFDAWMAERFPSIPFERYADDIVVHCRTERQAQFLRRNIEARLARCRLTLHPEKTRIVYCKDDKRTGSYPEQAFDFLGYRFQKRSAKTRDGQLFVGFSPAISPKAAKRIGSTIRRWNVHLRVSGTLEDLAESFNREVRGWIAYYGRYYKSALVHLLGRLNYRLERWAHRKYKGIRSLRRARDWLRRIARRQPRLFAHWSFGVLP
jgi:RNA-directed DNA polymerase